MRVESTGRVKLRSADPTWHPEIDPGYYADGADLDAMIAGYRTVFDVAGQGPLAEYIAEPWDPASSNPSTDDIVASIARRGQTAVSPRRHLRDGHRGGQRGRPPAESPWR